MVWRTGCFDIREIPHDIRVRLADANPGERRDN